MAIFLLCGRYFENFLLEGMAKGVATKGAYRKMKKRRLELDVLRVIACLVVYVYHTVIAAWQIVDFSLEGIESFWIHTPAWGGGVDVFLFISTVCG